MSAAVTCDDLANLASGTTGPTYTFQKPCPSTPGRVQQFKSFTGEEVPDVPTSDNDPLGALSQLKVSVAAVEEEDGTLARSLYEMIEDKSWANDLIVQAKRSGLKMLELLREFADTADESDAATETRYSTSAWLITITAAGACVAWGSTKQKCVALSTAEAEIIALSEAAKEVVYFRKFLRGVNKSYITGPTRLETDSKAAFDLSYNPEHHGRTKHVARRHFFVRDQVEEGEISVRLVKTDDNAADFFSKPLKPSSFFSLRDSIMNIQRE